MSRLGKFLSKGAIVYVSPSTLRNAVLAVTAVAASAGTLNPVFSQAENLAYISYRAFQPAEVRASRENLGISTEISPSAAVSIRAPSRPQATRTSTGNWSYR